MSCEKCDQFQDEGKIYCYRWKNATIVMQACDEHIKEIFAVLNAKQAEGRCRKCSQDLSNHNQEYCDRTAKLSEWHHYR